MKITRLPFALPLVAAVGFLGFAVSTARAHDPDEHHYYDHVRADELSHHADSDRYHAARATDRAYATGDPRDFFHALRDRFHAERAGHAAHDAQDHARGYGHSHGDD